MELNELAATAAPCHDTWHHGRRPTRGNPRTWRVADWMGEITDHRDQDKHAPAGRNGRNSRNGSRAETVLTEIGLARLEVPRDPTAPSSPRSSVGASGALAAWRI